MKLMKKSFILASAMLVLAYNISAQVYYSGRDGTGSFRKGSLLISASEGGTYTHYSTHTTNNNTNAITAINPNTNTNGNSNTNITGDVKQQGNENGDRDPLTIEYGLSNHWGIGINLGGDIFNVNSNKYYNYNGEMGQKTKVITSEATIDGHYHFFVTHHTDLSAFLSVGIAGVTIQGGSGETKYKYQANGGILRGGLQARYYVCKRFGFLAMVSAYTSKCDTKDVKDNTFGNNVSTTINGAAWELGMCVRLLK
jgi:hypothetical protein